MSILEMVGYASILFFVLLYPLILLRYYITREFVYLSPFFYGCFGGALFYAIPYMFLKMFFNWDMSRDRIWLFILVVAAVKALSGETGKRLTAMINNKGMYKWRYYLPMGVGFSYALLLSVFIRPFVRLFLSFQQFRETGLAIPPEDYFFGSELTGILLGILIIVAVVEMEMGLTVLTGLSRNRKSLRYWLASMGLSLVVSFLILYPWTSYWLRLAIAVGTIVLGLVTIVLNRDAFRKYMRGQKTFRGFN